MGKGTAETVGKGTDCAHHADELVMEGGGAVIGHQRPFVIQPEAGGEQPLAHREVRLMVKRHVPGADIEITADKKFIIRNVQCANALRNAPVGIVQDEALDAVAFEQDRCLHAIVFEEGKKAAHGLPVLEPALGPDDDLHRMGRAQLPLLQGKDAAGRIVLVHAHAVGQELERGNAVDPNLFPFIMQLEAFQDGDAAVTALVIVAHRVLHAVFPEAIGKAPLGRQSGLQEVTHLPPLRQSAVPPPAELSAVVGIGPGILEFVLEPAPGMPVAQAEGMFPVVPGHLCPHMVGQAVLQPGA